MADNGSAVGEAGSHVEGGGDVSSGSLELGLGGGGEDVALLADEDGAHKVLHMSDGGVVELGGDASLPGGLDGLKIAILYILIINTNNLIFHN